MVATPPWAARRALPAQKMVAARHWEKPAVCGEQGCSTAPAGTASASAARLPGLLPHCPHAENCGHLVRPAVKVARCLLPSPACTTWSPAQRGHVVTTMCLVPRACCSGPCSPAPPLPFSLKANRERTCYQNGLSRLQPLAVTQLQLMLHGAGW